jgi:hypothetical protein
MDYNSFSPIADKIVHSDGSITTFSGDLIVPPSAEGVALYESMLPTKDGFLQPDGSIKQLKDISGGGAENFCFGTSNTAANVAVKAVSIPAITSLNIGQVIYVLPSVNNALNDYRLKLNDFEAYPVWYRGANQSVVYINTWEAGITVRFIFTGMAWEVDAQIRRAVTTEWLAGSNTRPSSITPNQLYNVITNRLAADQYSNFVISDAPANDATKQISIPTITSLNVGQVIFVLPTTSTSGNNQNFSIKLNDFDAYPVRVRAGTPVATSGTYLPWTANVLSCYVFTGSYWDCIYTPPGGSLGVLTTGTSQAIYMWSARNLADWRKQYVPDLPITGTYTLKCIDGVPQWIAEK